MSISSTKEDAGTQDNGSYYHFFRLLSCNIHDSTKTLIKAKLRYAHMPGFASFFFFLCGPGIGPVQMLQWLFGFRRRRWARKLSRLPTGKNKKCPMTSRKKAVRHGARLKRQSEWEGMVSSGVKEAYLDVIAIISKVNEHPRIYSSKSNKPAQPFCSLQWLRSLKEPDGELHIREDRRPPISCVSCHCSLCYRSALRTGMSSSAGISCGWHILIAQ